MRQIHAIIFDLDDTLHSERRYAFSGFAAVAKRFQDHLGDPAATAKALEAIFDTPRRATAFDALLASRGIEMDTNLAQQMIEAYRNHLPTISLYADAHAALSRFRTACKMGIITDGRVTTQSLKLDALGLRSRVDEIIITDALGPGRAKPHPQAFELMVQRLDVEPAQCVYVADNAAKDFVAPNALGWTTVQIVRSDGIYSDCKPPPGGEPRRVLESLDDLDSAMD